MAYSLYEQAKYNDPSITEDTIQSDAIPRLAEWLFETFYDSFTTPEDKAIAGEFIDSFIRYYCNMEICSDKPEIFRSKLYAGLKKCKPYLTKLTPEYEALVDASVKLETISSKTGNATKNDSHTRQDSTTRDITQSVNEDRTTTQTISNTTDVTGTDTTEATRNSSGTNTGTTSASSTTNNSVSNDSRTVNSAYPQSVVNAGTSGNPDVMTWTYATDASDQHGNTSGETTTEQSGNSSVETTDNTTDNSTVEKVGKTIVAGTNKDIVDGTTETTGKDTYSGNSVDTIVGTSETTDNETHTVDSISQFDKLMKLLEYLKRNPFSPIYSAIDDCMVYFVSIFVDEERDGYIDPDTDVLKYLNEVM